MKAFKHASPEASAEVKTSQIPLGPQEVKPARASGSFRALIPAIYGLFTLAILYTLYFAKDFLVPIFIAAFLTFITKPIYRFLRRIKAPSWIAGGAVIFLLLSLFAVGLLQLTEPAKNWMTRIPESLRQLEYTVTHSKPAEQVTHTVKEVQKIADRGGDAAGGQIQIQTSSLSNVFLGWTTNFMASICVVFFLLWFFLVYGDSLTFRTIALFPRGDKNALMEMARKIESQISHYFFTITMINTGLGISIAVAMALIGVPNPVLWGVIGGALNFVPYIGAVVSMTAVTLAAFFEFQSVHALWAPAAYMVLTSLESGVLTPVILGRNFTFNPAIIFISIIFWGWLWGTSGVFLAVPIMMVLKIVSESVKSLSCLQGLLKES